MTTPGTTNENNLRKALGLAIVALGLFSLFLALNVAKEGAAFWALAVIAAVLFATGCLIGGATA